MTDEQKAERLRMIKRSWRTWKNDKHMRRMMDAPPDTDLLDYPRVSNGVRDREQHAIP